MDTNALDDDLLARYLTGECSAGEAEVVDRRLALDPRYRDDVELMACAWDVATGLPADDSLAGMWNRIAGELHTPAADRAFAGGAPVVPQASSDFALTPRVIRARRRWIAPLLAAAAIAVLAVGGFVAWRLRPGGRVPATVAARQNLDAQAFSTPRGQRATMTLLDGTRVALGPDSRLWVRIGESGVREAVLDGEAVFTVVHDTARPFRVRAGATVTEDLGTTFGIRSYAHEPVRVVVREGVVAVRDTVRNQSVVLSQRDLARVDVDGRLTVEHAVDPDAYLAWTTGRLVFRHTPLADVVTQIERWYDVRVVVENQTLLKTTVNASFDDDLDEVLRVLSDALDVHIERRERQVYLLDRN